MRRVLVIPAAGRGSRLQTAGAKALAAVNGRPMIDRLLDMYAEYTDSAVVVASPAHEVEIRRHCAAQGRAVRIAVQPAPTGMLDALLAAADAVRASDAQRVWITWCDQVAIHPDTIARLAALEASVPDAAVTLPTVRRRDPYIHFDRDASGRIVSVRHRREGDAMPAVGESDAGLFALSSAAFDALQRFGASANAGRTTAERNFLPFIPWLARTERVVTFECTDPREAIGVNTAEDLAATEQYLRERDRSLFRDPRR